MMVRDVKMAKSGTMRRLDGFMLGRMPLRKFHGSLGIKNVDRRTLWFNMSIMEHGNMKA
jgi:hypothetical protein